MNIFSGESEPEAYVGWGSLLLCSNIDIIIINAINAIIAIMIKVFSPSWPSSPPQSSIALSTITFAVITSRQDPLKWVWWTWLWSVDHINDYDHNNHHNNDHHSALLSASPWYLLHCRHLSDRMARGTTSLLFIRDITHTHTIALTYMSIEWSLKNMKRHSDVFHKSLRRCPFKWGEWQKQSGCRATCHKKRAIGPL